MDLFEHAGQKDQEAQAPLAEVTVVGMFDPGPGNFTDRYPNMRPNADAIQQAVLAAGDRYVNVLGADTARQCLEAGALEEILVCIAPVLLGDGVRLFDHPGGTVVALERLSVSQAPSATNLWFRVVT